MRVVFRTDASTRIGTGHVMRCLALADALLQRGVSSIFVCRAHEGNLVDAIRRRGFPVVPLPTPNGEHGAGDSYGQWLGVPQAQDADDFVLALADTKPDWVVVDHYGLDEEWEGRVLPHVGRLAVITDLDDRRHTCDLLLNQNYGAAPEHCVSLCTGRPQSTVLTGPRYALLRPEYGSRRSTQGLRDGRVRRVLVYFGGTDQENATGVALEALSHVDFLPLAVDVVVGVNHPQRAQLERLARERPNTAVHGMRPTLVDLMAAADLAIGAGGITTWERMCLGLPAIVVSTAENQRAVCEALSKDGLILHLGEVGSLHSKQIVRALGRAGREADQMRTMSARGCQLVDGLGVGRVAEALHPAHGSGGS